MITHANETETWVKMASADSAPCSRSAQSKRHCSSYCFDLIDHLSYLSWFVYADAFSCLPPTSLRLGGDVGGFKMEHGICFVTPIKRRNGGMSSGGRKSRVDRKRGGRGRWGGRLKQMRDDGGFLMVMMVMICDFAVVMKDGFIVMMVGMDVCNEIGNVMGSLWWCGWWFFVMVMTSLWWWWWWVCNEIKNKIGNY